MTAAYDEGSNMKTQSAGEVTRQEAQSVIDTIDALGVALADEGHTWSPELRRMYESAIALLTRIQEMRSAADVQELRAELLGVIDDVATEARIYGVPFGSEAQRAAARLLNAYEAELAAEDTA